MKRLAGLAMAVVLAFGPMAARADMKALEEAARKEGELTWYTTHYTSEAAEELGAVFTKMYGIKVNVVRTTAQVGYQRATQDFKAGQTICDVFSTTDMGHVLRFKAEGRLDKYVPENTAKIAEAFRNLDPDGFFHTTSAGFVVLTYNTSKVKPEDAPKKWADLLDPKWKGKIAFTDPANSGSAYTTVTMLVDMWGGGDAGWKKVAELFRNMKVLNRSSLVFQGVGNGEYPLGISLEYAGPMWAAGGAPVKVIYPNDGTFAAMEGVAIIKDDPNPEQAKAFVDFVNAKATREMILKATFRRPTRSDVDLTKLPGGMPPMSQLKLLKYDEEGWTDKRTQTLERIKDIIQDSR